MSQTTILTIENTGLIKVDFECDGIEKSKYITFDDLGAIIKAMEFKTQTKNNLTRVSADQLPQDARHNIYCIYHEVYEQDIHRVLIVKHAHQRQFSYHVDKDTYIRHDDVGYPALLFDLVYTKQHISKAYVYALDTNYPTSESTLFCYPYTNVSKAGSICFGSTKNNLVFQHLHNLKTIPHIFLNSENNRHLYRTSSNKENLEIIPLVERNCDKPFDVSLLCPITQLKHIIK